MTPRDATAIVAFTVRLPEAEHKQLVALAGAEHRPLNAQIRKMLTESMNSGAEEAA